MMHSSPRDMLHQSLNLTWDIYRSYAPYFVLSFPTSTKNLIK